MCRDVTGGGALRGSKLWCTRRQRITDTCDIGGRRARALSLTDPSVSPGQMWARAVVCAALLSALCPAWMTEAERDERGVHDYSYSNSNRLVGK